MRRPHFLAGFLFFALSAGCAAPEPQVDRPPMAEVRAAWEAARTEKDAYLRSARSPLPESLKTAFVGLPHYPFDSTLVFAVRLTPNLRPDTVMMVTTNEGRPERFVKHGFFAFAYQGVRYQLTAFKPVRPGPRYLFVPFRDGTTGRETYGAGRYLELDERADGDGYVLDFNRAITPYCVYNPRFQCPIPPAENTLAVPVRAGERVRHGTDVTHTAP